MLYKSKPSKIEAVQYDGDPFPVFQFAGDKLRGNKTGTDLLLLAGFDGVQGWIPVPIGHWVVRNPGDNSDLWPVAPLYFESKYEPVDD